MSVASWSYTVPLVASWARARSNGARRYTAPAHQAALTTHHLLALAARPTGWRTDGVCRVDIEYRPADRRRRDKDRVESLVLDALKGVAYDDDSDRYLVDGYTRCVRDTCAVSMAPGSTRVTVTRIGDAPVKVARKRGAR